ncbi:MAG: PCRF domain-containing protein, partial [Fibrobacterota bacterium]
MQLESRSAQNGFWDDASAAQKVLKEIKDLKRIVEPWERADQSINELAEFFSLAQEENDNDTLVELEEQADALEKEIAHIEFLRKLSGEDDGADAILTIHSGAGGTESCDWTEMLFRMYVRFMERKGYTYSILESSPGEEA